MYAVLASYGICAPERRALSINASIMQCARSLAFALHDGHQGFQPFGGFLRGDIVLKLAMVRNSVHEAFSIFIQPTGWWLIYIQRVFYIFQRV
jgi:hypothetical protein